MKLLTLEIHNIASLVDAKVDFASAELNSEPIFLVTGDTGSGKTSILNSICIALYNQVPALDEASKDEDNHGVRISSPLQLVRRYCKEASIILTFSDKEGTHYTVDWRAARVTRGANKGEFNNKSIQRTLTIRRKDGQQEHYSKLSEVSKCIESALGLTFEQFCRTTMLAQGQFLKFINSDKKHKSEILEKITGTEIYSQVGQQIFTITKGHKEHYYALDNQIKGAQLLGDDEKRQLAESVEGLSRLIEGKSKQLTELETYEKWLEAEVQTKESIEKVGAELAAATAEHIVQHINALRKTIEDWDATAEIRSIVAEALAANQAFVAKNAEVTALRPKFLDLARGLSFVVSSIDGCKRQISENQDAIDREKQYEPIYAAEGQIMALIGVIEDETLKISQCEIRIEQAKDTLGQANALCEKEQLEVDASKRALDEQQAEVDRLVNENEDIDAKALNERKDATAEKLDLCTKAIAAHKMLTDIEKEYADKVKETDLLKAALDRDSVLYSNALSERDRRMTESNDADSRLRGQMDLSERLAELTHIFKESRTCPLCGSEVEHLHTKEVIDDALNEAKKAAEEAKSAYQRAIERANDLAASVKSHTVNLTKAKGEIEGLKSKTDLCRRDFEAFGMLADSLATQYDATKRQLDLLSEALAKAIEMGAKLHAAMAERDVRRKALDFAQQRMDKAKTKVVEIETSVNKDKATVFSLTEGKQANLNKLGTLLLEASHPSLSVDDLEGVKTILPKLKARYDSLLAFGLELKDKRVELERTAQEVADKLALLSASFGAVDPTAEPQECPDIVREASLLSACVLRINGQIEEIERRRGLLAQKEVDYFAAHDRAATMLAIDRLGQETAGTIAHKRQQINDYDVSVAGLKGKMEQLSGRLNELLATRPTSLPEDLTLQQATADKVMAKSEIEELAQQRTKDASRLEQNAEREKALARQRIECERAKKEYYKWDSLNKLLGAENGERFRNLAQAYIFGQLLRSANQFLLQLTDRYTLEGEIGSLVIYVIDHHDGGNKRVAKALSGGEGFMASLSLALALSAINQDLDPLDILFIDEGFGALDPTAREFTIDMLCSLRRRVCIISHMPELRECIPTQIVVTRHPGTSRSTLTLKTN